MRRSFSTRSEFQDGVRELIAQAQAQRERRLWFCDPDFADWPLNEPALIEQLSRWAGPGRELTLLAQHYDEVQRRHPRFVAWRRTWGHCIDARVAVDLPPADHPGLLLLGAGLQLQVIDRLHWRGWVTDDARDASLRRDELDAYLQRSTPGFASSVMGL
jgi:hypothetical protein